MIALNISDISTIHIYFSRQSSVNIELIAAATKAVSHSGKFKEVNNIDQLVGNTGTRLLVIDGSDDQLGLRELQKMGITPTFHLVVSDLGIHQNQGQPLSADDLELVIDAIEAACTTPDNSPKFNCPCSG